MSTENPSQKFPYFMPLSLKTKCAARHMILAAKKPAVRCCPARDKMLFFETLNAKNK
jgi:hypothetical protein